MKRIISDKYIKIIGILVALVSYFLIKQIPIEGLSALGSKSLAFLCVVVLILMLDIIPIGIMGLFIIVMPSIMGLVDEAVAFGSFGSGAIFFIYGVFILALGFEDTSFGHRVSLYINMSKLYVGDRIGEYVFIRRSCRHNFWNIGN